MPPPEATLAAVAAIRRLDLPDPVNAHARRCAHGLTR